MKSAYMPINRQMNKTCNMQTQCSISLKKNQIAVSWEKWIQLEITMLGKIGQTSKCKCDIFSLTWSILGEKYARQNIEEEKGDLGGKKGLN